MIQPWSPRLRDVIAAEERAGCHDVWLDDHDDDHAFQDQWEVRIDQYGRAVTLFWCSTPSAYRGGPHPETGEKMLGEHRITCRCQYHDGIRGCASGNRVVMMNLRRSLATFETAESRKYDDD